jgi:Glycosyl transferases group 1
MLASLPWKARLFGRLADGATDEAGIQAGVLDRAEIPEAIRRFRLAINFSQRFDDVEKRYAFTGLKKFGEYFFPSRMVLYAAVGIPTVSLTLPGLDPPFGSVITATDRDEVVARIGEVIDDRQALTELSRRARADFEECLTAQSRAALMLSLLDGPHDHDRATRANLWRSPA